MIKNLKGYQLADDLLRFLNKTGSPYHSVDEVVKLLVSKNFTRLHEDASTWRVEKDKGYFVTRNGSTVAAFYIGKLFSNTSGGIGIVAAHTDSPCLRVKPNHHVTKGQYLQVDVECYGGGLWHTWFDRGLGLAGKVVKRSSGALEEVLVRIKRPILIVPNLAIHLQSAEERAAFKLNKEEHLRPIIASVIAEQLANPEKVGARGTLVALLALELGCSETDIVDFDLCLMDATDGRLCGAYEEFIESPRLDNLVSTYAGFRALAEDTNSLNPNFISAAVSFDHEEVGSGSWVGAQSSAMQAWIARILNALKEDPSPSSRVMANSFLLSVDMAHAVHPNYAEKHQMNHQPQMHKGIVLKENSNQRYTSECTGLAAVRELGRMADVPMQEFVVKNDSPCGSTIGPILCASLGIRSVDLGICQWAMHSCRETCGVQDLYYLSKLFKTFFEKGVPSVKSPTTL